MICPIVDGTNCAFPIGDDYNPDGDILHGADPMPEYHTYLDCVRAGAVGDIKFTVEDFRRYITGLRANTRKGNP